MTIRRPAAIARLPEGYGKLFEQVVAAFQADERIRGAWLSGSLARGLADRASDLDFLIAVRDEDHPAFAETWEAWLASLTPTVLARPLPNLPGSFYSLTPEGLRLDVVVEPVSALPATPFRHRTTVLDRDRLSAQIPGPAPMAGPDRDRIAALIEEFFRQQANLPTVTERRDWLLGVVAVQQLHLLLYQLFVEANAPLRRVGVKHWSAKLRSYQRRVLESLPVPQPERNSVLEARAAAASAFVVAAKPIADRLGVPWPAALEAAVDGFLRRELGFGLTN